MDALSKSQLHCPARRLSSAARTSTNWHQRLVAGRDGVPHTTPGCAPVRRVCPESRGRQARTTSPTAAER